MKNAYYKLKSLSIILLLIVSTLFASAQVNVNLNIIPPYSPFFRDYMGYLNNKTVVTLFYTNPAAMVPIQVYLSASIRKDDNSVTVQVKDSYKPNIPITLVPNIPQTLTGTQLRNIFGNGTTNDLILTGMSLNETILNQALKEGNYSICIKVKDYNTGNLIAESCSSIYITYCEPPQIFSPLNNSIETAKTPQNILISWTPTTPAVLGVNYRLRILKLMNGISATDALNYNTQVIFEKSDINRTSYPLDLASGVKLDTGSVYVMQVTASSSNALIKNGGKSEPVQFMYKGQNSIATEIPKDIKLMFLSPRILSNKNAPDTLKVNNQSDLMLNWFWTSNSNLKQSTNDTLKVNDFKIINDLGVQQYILAINKIDVSNKAKKTDKSFSFTKIFTKNQNDSIQNYLQLTNNEATDAGFEDGTMYKATLNVYDKSLKLLKTELSNNFIFKTIKNEDPLYYIPIQAILKYSFKNFPEIYSIKNSEICIEALKKQQGDNMLKSLPAILINNKNYVNICSSTLTTDTLGRVATKFAIPQKYFDTDSIYFRLKLSNKYYVDKDFKMISLAVSKKDSLMLSFGSLLAKTYAYQLKLKVTKNFSNYKLTKDEKGLKVELGENTQTGSGAKLGQNSSNNTDDQNQSYTYNVNESSAAIGIPVVLYRENKQSYIPTFEGNIQKEGVNNYSGLKKITVVATGLTQLENGKSYVTFNKLLSTNFQNEEYKILAIRDLDSWLNAKNYSNTNSVEKGLANQNLSNNTNQNLKSQNKGTQLSTQFSLQSLSGNLSPELNNLLAEAIESITNSSSSMTNFVDSNGFIATVMPFKLSLPTHITSDAAYYRTVNADYEITSCKPPTSIIKGRLFYTWKSDNKNLIRPLANTHFRVMVDYVDDKDKSIGSVSNRNNALKGLGGSWEYTYFEKNGSDEVIPLVDQYATMAEGKTDADGNFQLEVVNFNKKGSLGAGTVTNTKGSSKPPVTGTSLKDELKNFGEEVINPWNENGEFGNNYGQSQNQQGNQLNNSFSIGFDAQNNSFEVSGLNKGGKALTGGTAGGMMNAPLEFVHGPNPSIAPALAPAGNSEEKSTSYSDFKRIFRVVIDGNQGQYYYPSKDVITIQPFEIQSNPQSITHFVKEFKLTVSTKELNSNNIKIPLSGVQVTLFRNITDPKNKPKNLPQGEGDGKYQFTELINPEYTSVSGVDNKASNFDANSIYNKKFEQLWPTTPVNALLTGLNVKLPHLLQAQFENYFVHSSSYVNKGSKTYKATIVGMPDIEDNTLDWTNPEIPEVKMDVVLSPLFSRALVRAKDAMSGQTLTTDQQTRIMISKSNFLFYGNFKTKYVDKYGYAEFIANQPPMSDYVKSNDVSTDIFFYAKATGYNLSTQQQKAQFLIKGNQSAPVISVVPSSVIKGKVITPDYKVNGFAMPVDVYLQVDSGTVFDLKDVMSKTQNGYFEVPIAPIAGAKLKIIPKDVAYFDTAYVLTNNDLNKSIINLNTINVYRRQHRIKFDVFTKAKQGSIIQNVRVKNATIQLGDVVNTTDQNGSTKFQFENVSVNNYTFIVKGPNGQGYIPKTINLKSVETRDFVNETIELEKGSEVSGTVTLDGKPVKNAKVYIDVSNTTTQLSPNINGIPALGNNLQQSTLANTNLTPQSQTGYPSLGQTQNQSGYNVQNQGNILGNTSLAPEGKIDSDANLVVAYTNAQGKYKLMGVPIDNQKINIIATIDTSFTVSGDKKEANILNGSAITDLNLTRFDIATIDRLFGFPLTVEKITPVSNNKVQVTGLVHWTEALSDFNLEEVNKVLRVEDVVFNLVNKNNKKVGVVNGNSVKLNGITSLKLSYLNKYNVKLSASNYIENYNSQVLSIIKENDLGKISGKMQIVDNSFNYPSSYLNFDKSFFFLSKLNTDSTVNNTVSVATSAFTENESLSPERIDKNTFEDQIKVKSLNYYKQSTQLYNLCDNDAKAIEFKLINFDAKANPKKSFIDKTGKIHLNVDLSCYIPNAQPENFTLNIDDIVLDDNNVYRATGSKPITVMLEKWKLEARNWEFSTTEGGIISTDAMIRTQIVDIPVGKFILRHDMFNMSHFKMDKLSLANGKFPLIGVDTTKAHLNYEYKVGTNMQPHWNFCLLSNGTTKVASLPNLAGLVLSNNQPYKVDLNYIEILSNNEMIVQLMQKPEKAYIKANSLAKYEPLSIYNGPNYISLTGALNIAAPRMSDMDLTMRWTSPFKYMDFETITTDFEGKGFVHFKADKDSINITNSQIKIEGKVLEKPNKTFNPIPATLFASKYSNPVYEVKMRTNWVTQLTEDEPNGTKTPLNSTSGYSLKIEKGGMSVVSGDWTTCSFDGMMHNNQTNSKNDNIVDTKTKFEILGDISASSNSAAISDVETPLGSMSQTFDFKNKRLIGSLMVKSETTLGTIVLHSGTIETCFDPSGFYVAGGCNAFIPAGIFSGNYNTGMMAGSYKLTDHLWNITNSYIDPAVVNKCYKASTKDLKGFYFAFNREILDVEISKDYVLASGYVKALALLGGDFYANFASNAWKVGADGYVYVGVAAGLSAITGTSISGSTSGEGRIMFQLGNPTYIKTTINLDFSASISQSLGFTTISESVSVDCAAEGGNNGFSFSLGSAGSKLSCPPATEESK